MKIGILGDVHGNLDALTAPTADDASRPPPGSAVPTPVERRIRLELDGDMLTT